VASSDISKLASIKIGILLDVLTPENADEWIERARQENAVELNNSV
jgi:hypothetical protein